MKSRRDFGTIGREGSEEGEGYDLQI
ncbi:hypothetical protein TIFTF001_029726 [Ficus carica]|uniref:Uncharacterized protein n=1 Tax=Ficus carica TaxID=3494 RepID=A0AA88DS64_FICCA|nr:hypothetical protein TIFTF001_029726 [Ficus carica]